MQMRKFGWGGWLGSLISMSGFTMRGLGNRGVVKVHPGLYLSILHKMLLLVIMVVIFFVLSACL